MNIKPQFDPKSWLAEKVSRSELKIEILEPSLWFALIWNRYELWACDCDATLSTMGNHVKSNTAGLNAQSKFSEHWALLREFLSNYGCLRNVDDLSYFLLSDKKENKSEKKAVEELYEDLKNESIEIIMSVRKLLFVSYRIRNNLFHGEKCVSSLENQKELFVILNHFLADYVDSTNRKC